MTDIVEVIQTQVVVQDEDTVSVVTAGTQGPPGPPGPSGAGSTDLVYTAGANLSGHRIVVLEAGSVVYASAEDITHASRVLGMTTGAANAGSSATIRTSGEIEEPSWNWTPGLPIFLGANGTMTQTQPESPSVFSVVVAFPLTPTRAFIRVREPILI